MTVVSANRAKRIFGLIGKNVDYSWSPLIHNTAFETLGMPCVYTIFNIASPELVADALRGSRALGIQGFSVTIPYKKTVVPFLDELSPEAQTIRAVNTIVNDNGHLSGHNTDISGFAAPLLPWAERIRGKRVCIFGNGGAALAAIEAFRLHFRPSSILLFVRELHKADEMLDGYLHRSLVTPCLTSDLELPLGGQQLQECSVIVNATPVGTAGRTDAGKSAVPSGRELFHPGQIVYDMVYNPLETPLLAEARSAGAETVSGIEMLLAQAASAFFIWTGCQMPVDTVRNVLMHEIGEADGHNCR
ncbi:MAG: shikimate dehydrogenase [Chlorobiaceae bacterium]|nr:shikimate dehydrogenase [Chlorobiaceae bacterium]NTW73413.1 shikimate dehydrogenase [Chlorobiaceae bacterium]